MTTIRPTGAGCVRHGTVEPHFHCDYWLPERAKCDEVATIEAADRHGAPLRFCPRHWGREFAADLDAQYGQLRLVAVVEDDWCGTSIIQARKEARRTARRAGQVRQIDFQARSHDAADCGTYRLISCVGPNRWTVEYIAPCDDDFKVGTIRFIRLDTFDRYF